MLPMAINVSSGFVRTVEQTSEIALSELKDKEDKERYFSQLLQLAIKEKEKSTQKGGRKTAIRSSSSLRKKGRTNKTRPEIPVFQ